jgi:two-component system, NarL family, response regulator NreC
MTARIFIADDHRLLREGLRSLLEGAGYPVVGEAEDGRTCVGLVKKLQPHVVIIDIGMPLLNGVEATRQIRREVPSTKVIVISMHSESRFILGALAAGASGYLLKDAAFEELGGALKAILKGQTYLSPAIAHLVVRRSLGRGTILPSSQRGRISSREREVLQLVAEGRSTKEIAAALYVSVKTVETHRKQIMDKLNVHSIAELTKYAIREGVTSL